MQLLPTFLLAAGINTNSVLLYGVIAVVAVLVLCAVWVVLAKLRRKKNPRPEYFETLVQEVAKMVVGDSCEAQADEEASNSDEDASQTSEENREDASESNPNQVQQNAEEEPQDTPQLIDVRDSDVVADAALREAYYTAPAPARTGEEAEIASVAEEQAAPEEQLVQSMVDTQGYEEFDFGAEFEEWPEEEEDAAPTFKSETVPEDVLASLGQEVEEDDEDDADDADEGDDEDSEAGATAFGGAIAESKYRRSFLSKLIQGTEANKQYYQVLKNELLSYEGIRCKEAWGGESYALGRRTYARLAVAGKTLCVFLALNPDNFDPAQLHHRNKGDVRKYASTPMMMRVRSDLSLRRTITLIAFMAGDNDFHKKTDFAPVDYSHSLAYKTDEELLQLNLIKLNTRYVQTLSGTVADLGAQLAEAEARQFRSVTPVKKEQVGHLSDDDVDRINRRKEPRPEGARQVSAQGGKFVIEGLPNGYRFMFYASNGKLLLASGIYKNKETAYKAVGLFRTAIDTQDATMSVVDDQYFYTVAYRGRTYTSVMYATKGMCFDGYQLAKEAAQAAVVEYYNE